MKSFITAFFLGSVLFFSAQGQSTIAIRTDTSLYVFGVVSDDQTQDTLPDSRITIQDMREGFPDRELHANADGKYSFYLGRGARYRVTYTRFDRTTKTVEIDAASVPDSSWHGGMSMEINMTLPKPFRGSDDAVFHEPIGRSRYNPATNLLEWDMEYTQLVKERRKARREELK
ncbi:MAG: hypothetical protein JST38_09015 [Bacteroidetes bacterium]|nr:hypothetical protein [Bacteroidota bacterium]MBS1941002.1 hypothetical protein [Bacteroidota bacterium]